MDKIESMKSPIAPLVPIAPIAHIAPIASINYTQYLGRETIYNNIRDFLTSFQKKNPTLPSSVAYISMVRLDQEKPSLSFVY